MGIFINFIVGKFVLSSLFAKRVGRRITLRSATIFESVQHVLSYMLGFAIGGLLLLPQVFFPLIITWIIIQTLLALHIFAFKRFVHGLTFVGVDTSMDIVMGMLFGFGTMMTIIRLGLLK